MARGVKNRIQAVGLPVSACIDQHETFEPISPSQLLLCCSRIKVLGIGAVRNQSQLFTETAPGELALHARCKDDDNLGPLIEGRFEGTQRTVQQGALLCEAHINEHLRPEVPNLEDEVSAPCPGKDQS